MNSLRPSFTNMSSDIVSTICVVMSFGICWEILPTLAIIAAVGASALPLAAYYLFKEIRMFLTKRDCITGAIFAAVFYANLFIYWNKVGMLISTAASVPFFVLASYYYRKVIIKEFKRLEERDVDNQKAWKRWHRDRRRSLRAGRYAYKMYRADRG